MRSTSTLRETALKHWLLGALVVVAALVSAGSASSEPRVHVYALIACGDENDSGDLGRDVCSARAAQLCPGGYTILSQDYGDDSSEAQEWRFICRQPSGAGPS